MSAMTQTTRNQVSNGPTACAAAIQMISSFEKNPANGQMPAIASVPIHIVTQVTGMYFFSPPMLRMSCASAWLCVWCSASCIAWMTAPEPRNSSALKKACVIRWKMPAANAPTPTPMNMYPSCETVEYASTFLMSVCTSPIVAATSAVSAPIPATEICETGASANGTLDRATRQTPAVTIVAAWISAETGVGPAIASGSQTYSGICALLPTAPMKKNSVIAVTTAPP